MASLIPDYEYDIFISYRQKDNKGDRWVSEFVEALKTELESTFKEEISVYFDINPHDGLLETHDVNASLKDKLKCVVFIPIISRTYCDTKSFAWEHEFKTFIELASQDQFGLKVKLPNGNVASRVLPVRIYDLDTNDMKLCESILAGVIRSVDFIYKSAGVNRPLSANEDHPHDNLNKTYYRDQINKVANSIKEIITSIGAHVPQNEEVPKEVFKPISVPRKNNKAKITFGLVFGLALVLLGYFLIPTLTKPKEQLEKSIAVLPFFNDSPSDSTTYFINGLMEEILNNLQKIKDFRVLSRNSVEQFRNNTTQTTPEIAKKLGVNYIVEGSGQKYGNTFRLRVQLIAANNEKHLWAESYEQEIKESKDIYGIQSEIAQSIASELKATITPEEKQLIEKAPTVNLTAYDFYQQGEEEMKKYWTENSKKLALEKAEELFKESLKYDSTFARAYVGLAYLYWNKHYNESYLSQNFLDTTLILTNKALSFDSQLGEGYTIRGQYYIEKGLMEKANEEFDKALKYNSNDYEAYSNKGMAYFALMDFVQSIDNLHKGVARNKGTNLPDYLRQLGTIYLCAGFVNKEKYYYNEAFKLDKDSATYLGSLEDVEWYAENFEAALKLAKQANRLDSTKIIAPELYYFLPPSYNEEAYLNAKKWIEYSKKTGDLLLRHNYRIAFAFWRVGKYKEAKYYFNRQIKYDEGSIKLGRWKPEWGASYYDLAATYAFLGDKVKAYKYLDEFDKMKSYVFWWIVAIKHEPYFDSIRSEARFQQILQNVEAKYQAEHERVGKWLEEQGML